MRLIDANKLPYSNIKTNEYGYVETTKSVVLEEDVVNAQTVRAIPLDKVKQAREEIKNIAWKSCSSKTIDGNRVRTELIDRKDALAVLDKLIEESEG